MPGGKGPHHTDAWRRCVKKVDERGDGDPYAICTASLQRTDNVYETREGKLIRKAMDALSADVNNIAAFGAVEADDDEGRGDVAPPAVHMPRSNGHSGVPGGLQPPPPEGETAWEMGVRCCACGGGLSIRDRHRKGLCEACEQAMDDMVADGDKKHGTVPAVRSKVGATYQAPPPPGPPLRLDKDEKGHGSYPRGGGPGADARKDYKTLLGRAQKAVRQAQSLTQQWQKRVAEHTRTQDEAKLANARVMLGRAQAKLKLARAQEQRWAWLSRN